MDGHVRPSCAAAPHCRAIVERHWQDHVERRFVKSLEKLGPEPYYLASEPFAAFVRDDVPVWTEHARIAGIEPR